MNIESLTIRKLKNNLTETDFLSIYTELLRSKKVSDNDIRFILKIAILFLNSSELNITKLGYRLLLRYTNIYKEYKPLYDASINLGYIPISKFIEEKFLDEETISQNFFNTYLSAFKDTFKNDKIYLSYGQQTLIDFSENTQGNLAIVAPTSYGKSEIIISKVLTNLDKKLCVVVPTKALLAQTKRRLLDNVQLATKIKRVITHPEMYKGNEESFVAVLTQERLLRLLQRNSNVFLDIVLIDEAHNLLKSDARATLLAQVLLILKSRKPSTIFNFFTPFLVDGSNLEMSYANYIVTSKYIYEYLKIERFYHIDINVSNQLYLYDQFLNQSVLVHNKKYHSEKEFLEKFSSGKNIIYLNRPKEIEELAKELCINESINTNDKIVNLIDAISDFLHPDYDLLECIKSGIVYHHGSVPDIIRLYVEDIFSKVSELKYIITNSTLLEGVNIPAEKIFILSCKAGRSLLSASQFKNLIGRVCRFSEIFNEQKGNLDLLEPEIYIVKSKFSHDKLNPHNFLKGRVKSDKLLKDEVKNEILIKDINSLRDEQKKKLSESLSYLENIEGNTVTIEGIKYAESEIAQLCFKNNVHDFDIIKNEKQLVKNFENVSSKKASSANELVELIYAIFIKRIDTKDENSNFHRLKNEPAQRFYSMILEWRTTGSSYKQMIGKFLSYWNSLEDKKIFVGSRWGEITITEHSFKQLYIDLTTKSEKERVNIAIHRIKEEQDYVDNNLIKYIEILYDLKLVNKKLYEEIKYGTSDSSIITLLKNGFSLDLARCLLKTEYSEFININNEADEVSLEAEVINAMNINNENPILVFEVTYHINTPI